MLRKDAFVNSAPVDNALALYGMWWSWGWQQQWGEEGDKCDLEALMNFADGHAAYEFVKSFSYTQDWQAWWTELSELGLGAVSSEM